MPKFKKLKVKKEQNFSFRMNSSSKVNQKLAVDLAVFLKEVKSCINKYYFIYIDSYYQLVDTNYRLVYKVLEDEDQ
jgi:hypothetical protein